MRTRTKALLAAVTMLMAGLISTANASEHGGGTLPALPSPTHDESDKSPALCPEDHPRREPGVQGDVPFRMTPAWDCGVRQVSFLRDAERPVSGAMAVAYPCAYTGTSVGVRVIDVSNPLAPKIVDLDGDGDVDNEDVLKQPGGVKTSARELLAARVSEDRAILATRRRNTDQDQPADPANGRVLGKDMAVHIWDLKSKGCTAPQHMGSVIFETTDKLRGDPQGETGGPAHNLGLSPDAKKVYGTIPLDEADISHPDPREWQKTVRRIPVPGGTHEPTFSPDGSRLYVGGQIPRGMKMTILNMNQRDAAGNPTVVSETDGMPGHSIDYATTEGPDGKPHTYLLHSNEIGGTACIPEAHRPRYVGMGDRAWFLDITTEKTPTPVGGGEIMMADSHFEKCGPQADPANVNSGGPSLAYHHIDDPLDSTYAVFGFGSAGFRFYDIRKPWEPREVAYFNHGSSSHTKPYIIPETGQIWVSGAGGFRVLELEPQVREYLGLDEDENLPNVPKSKEDCANGGWKNHTDHNNKPFKNQGDCVSYVATHPQPAAAASSERSQEPAAPAQPSRPSPLNSLPRPSPIDEVLTEADHHTHDHDHDH